MPQLQYKDNNQWKPLALTLKGKDGLTTSVNGVEQVDGDITLTAADIPLSASDATTVRTALTRRDRVRNLLDNSYFRDPVNQHPWSSGTPVSPYAYFIDRWQAYSDAITPTFNGGLVVPSGSIYQSTNQLDPLVGKTVTAACCFGGDQGDTLLVASGTVVNNSDWGTIASATDSAGRSINFSNNVHNGWVFVITTGGAPLQWAALYEGAYTADTLPAYVPKGYAAEVIECKRQYIRMQQPAGTPLAYGGTYGTGNARFKIPTPVPMRTAPTITAGKGIGNLRVMCNGTQYIASAISGIQVKPDGILFQVTSDGIPSAHAAALVFAEEDALEVNATM